jgi:amino acid adenylation domain-containing protein
MLTPGNVNNSFGEGGDGYVRGEGGVAVVIGKEAFLQSSPVYAKILGSVINHDGKSASFTAPNGTAQRNLLKDVLEKCSVSPSEIGYIECHGTGTRLGDPIEWTAIKEVFLQEYYNHPLYLGALKANIGHLEGAAGLAGLLKAILSVFHGTLPKTPITEVNKLINMDSTDRKAIISTESVELDNQTIAGVSSFGSGGSNGHVLIQAFKKGNYRKFSKPPRIAFIFSGQGGLTHENATQIYQNDEYVRSMVRTMDDRFKLQPTLSSIFKDSSTDWLVSPISSCLVLFAIEMALYKLWYDSGVSPSVVLGHSFGEIAASVAANALSLEEAMDFVYLRALALEKFKVEGGVMFALRVTFKEASDALEALGYLNSNLVSIASINGPKSVVLSGSTDAINQVVQFLRCSSKQLRTNLAYHSPFLRDAAQELRSTFHFPESERSLSLPLISCLTGDLIETEKLRTVDYWTHQMLSPVQYDNCINQACKTYNCQLFIEIGPDSTFSALASACIPPESIDSVHLISSFHEKSFSDLVTNIHRTKKLIEGKNLGGRYSKNYKPILMPWRLLQSSLERQFSTSPQLMQAKQNLNASEVIKKGLTTLVGEDKLMEINNYTSFVSMGIDSLSALVLRNYISHAFNLVDLPHGLVFQYQNIAELTEHIADMLESQGEVTEEHQEVEERVDSEFETSNIQQSMIFHHISDPTQASFIETFIWEFKTEGFEQDSFVALISNCINFFPSLRTTFDPFKVPVATQKVIAAEVARDLLANCEWIQIVDWRNQQQMRLSEYETSFASTVENSRQQLHDLSHLPLFLFTIVLPPDHLQVSASMVFTIHHLITDGVSMSLLLKKIDQYSRHGSINEEESPSYQLVVNREKCVIEENAVFKSYWTKIFKEHSRFIKQQTKNWVLDLNDNEVIREYLRIPDYSALVQIARQTGITLSCLFHALFGIYFTELFNSDTVCYGTTVYGRLGSKIANVFGPTLNTIPFFHKVSSDYGLNHYLKLVQNQLFDTLENGSLPLSEILKVSSEVVHSSNKLFNLIFDYQQNRWDFSYANKNTDNKTEPSLTKFNFVKLLDRIGCPLSLRVLVHENDKNITLIATSESSEYTSEYLQTVLQGFHEMILSVMLLWKDSNTLDSSIHQLKRQFQSSFQVKQQKFSSVFPTVKGKLWSLPYVDCTLQCNKKIVSNDALVLTIFSLYCLSLAKYCNAEFLGVVYGQENDNNLTIPFSLHFNETLNEMVERVEELLGRNIRGTNKDSPIFLTRDDIRADKYPVALRILKISDDGAVVRLHWNLDDIPLEVRNLVVQSLQIYFSKWYTNKNEIYRHPVVALKQDVTNIHPYLPDVPFENSYMHQNLLTGKKSSFQVVNYCEDGKKECLNFQVLKRLSYYIAKSVIKEVHVHEIPKNVEERIRLSSMDNDELSQSCNGVIAVVMEKGWEQVVACLSILRIGHAYLPMDAKSWSEHRIRQVLEISEAVAVLTQGRYLESETGSWLKTVSIPVVTIDDKLLTLKDEEIDEKEIVSYNPRFQPLSTDQLAYLIYTSGSTGLPKGVCCHHKGAMNTIYDLNDHFEVTSADKILGLSSLSFDLSVYDIFGMLASGGCLVLPAASTVSPPDPAEWYNIVVSEGVTIWNTVPAFMELLVTHLEIIGSRLPDCLRLIYMSGDWIPINLPSRIRAVSDRKDLKIISMGGATEASIWSNIFEIEAEGSGIPEGWTSVPYGQPMRNQEMYILNEKLEPCELWVTGGIYIGGVGVAHGYYKNEDRTKYHFITHPKTGEKLFRTGDLGRIRPGGLLEILGREDNQVKVNGFRIELGEIEKTLLQHDKVQNSVVTVQNNSLCAYIVLRDISDSDSDSVSVTSDYHEFYDELKSICHENLTEYMIPQHLMVIDKVPLSPNGKIARELLPKLNAQKFSIPDSFSWNEKESILLNVWSSVLNADESTITPNTNFFTVGGDSLRSIQVVAQCKSLGLIVSIPNIFKFPTIRTLAANSSLMRELGPEILGTSTEAVSTKAIFEIENRDNQPHEEYPLIGINQAHFVGLHTSSFASEGMTPQIYFEWEFSEKTLGKSSDMKQLDVSLLETAIDLFIERHLTFRSVVTTHGTMKPLEVMPHYKIEHVYHWNTENPSLAEEVWKKNRKEMTSRFTTVHNWPLFEVRITQISDSSSIIHIAVSLFLMDAMSDLILRQELSALYRGLHLGEDPGLPPAAKISFKDYCIALTNQLPLSVEYLKAKKYWLERLPYLKSGPELPLLPASLTGQGSGRSGNFINRHVWLTSQEYSRAKTNCAFHSVTLPSVLLACYAIALGRFASSNEFLLNILLCLRHQVHEDVNKLVGNCSSTVLCNIDLKDEEDGSPLRFLSAVRRIAKELSHNLEYSVMSGVEIMQELNRRKGNTFQAVAPFIFTTPIGVEQGNRQVSSRNWMFQELFFSERVPHTACVNAIKADPNGTACASMDFVDGQFPIEIVEGVFEVYTNFVKLLCASSPSQWNNKIQSYLWTPSSATCYDSSLLPVTNAYLHDGMVNRPQSQSPAVIVKHQGNKLEISYKQLNTMSCAVVSGLTKRIKAASSTSNSGPEKDLKFPNFVASEDVKCNGVIAVVMEKGWEQVVACLSILRIGHAYLPMDAKSWSEHRIRQVLEISEAVAVLTQGRYLESETGSWLKTVSIPVVTIDDKLLTMKDEEIDEREMISSEPRFQPLTPDQLAYLIYTSGSTGVPKGVCCHHKGAMNTIYDLNDHFKVTNTDKILGLSSLSFDLSVYDIFGMLASGGCLVLPAASTVSPPDPAEWYNIVVSEGVTIWNTVPAFMELLVSHLEITGGRLPDCLRLIYMSGDWIPINLPSRIRAVSDRRDLKIISMGGATEASIWSNIFEIAAEGSGIPEGWTSIPYGQPMRNQIMYILNEKLEPCELWVTGGIYIGGVGVAHGYYKNEDRTKYQFITHPKTGEKLFRTGDLGRIRPGGLLEILGREDNQVKVNGFRIELGEIEKTLLQHDKVQNSVVTVQNNSLCAYIVMNDGNNNQTDPNQKLYDSLFKKLKEICKKQLTEYMIPQNFMIIQEVPLSSNGKIARDRLPKLQSGLSAAGDNSAENQVTVVEPKNDLQKEIRRLFAMILNISETSICCENQTFFSLGGNSLSSIQLLMAIRKHLQKIMTVQDLFQHSTVLKIYEFLYPEENATTNEDTGSSPMNKNQKKLFSYVLSKGKPDYPVVFLFNPAGASGLWYEYLHSNFVLFFFLLLFL